MFLSLISQIVSLKKFKNLSPFTVTTNQSFWEIEVLGEIFEDLQRLFGEG